MYNFYCLSSVKKLIISNLPKEKIQKKFGYNFEILTSVKEQTSVQNTLDKLLRSYSGYKIEEHYQKVRSNTGRGKSKSPSPLLGVPRSVEVKAKIAASCKGRSNFHGKTHNLDTKARMAAAKLGNNHVKGKVWAHDPRSDKEIRVSDINSLPSGFSKGRDYFSTENGLYSFRMSHFPE
jgi:hypothetical protein